MTRVGRATLFGWLLVGAGAALAAAERIVSGWFLMWIGSATLVLGVVVLLAARLARRRPRPIEPPGSEPTAARGPVPQVGHTYTAITRFAAGRGRIRVNNASVGALGEDTIGPGDKVEVVLIADGQARVRRLPPTNRPR